MKLHSCIVLLICIIAVKCYDDHVGTKIGKVMIHYSNVRSRANPLGKTFTDFNYNLPTLPITFNRFIQGIEVFDLTHSAATATIMQGGLGYNFVNLRLVSDYGRPVNYDVFIYI